MNTKMKTPNKKNFENNSASPIIRNIWAIGRNYRDHAKELNNKIPEMPMIFLKAGTSASLAENEIILPAWSEDVHHEIELALQFDDNMQIHRACVALDLTERKKQNELKAQGHPWTLAKSFTGACPLSRFFPVSNLAEAQDLQLILTVNGQVRQQGATSLMIFTPEVIINYVRYHFPVVPGDLLLTGTPAGVGPLHRGDQVTAEIVGKITHAWLVK